MKIFACSACQQVLFFDNVRCEKCGRGLAYLPGRGIVGADETRLCQNYTEHAACSWGVAEDGEVFCRACRFNDVIPDLSDPAAKAAWLRVEAAKRRLFYTLIELGLPLERKQEPGDRGLAFAFKQDTGEEKVFTGHSDGLITINVAEADDPFREKTRKELGETYRTLLGHFRHEIGHYYFQRLIPGSRHETRCRELFGDEREDYAAALQRHYDAGPPADWPARFVSAYASMHPAEDWAETWAHYLHMVDTLETARSYGLALRPRPEGGPQLPGVAARRLAFDDFDDLMNAWVPLTVALNSLNRSMGLPDLYPFVLPAPAVDKLRFVHDVIEAAKSA